MFGGGFALGSSSCSTRGDVWPDTEQLSLFVRFADTPAGERRHIPGAPTRAQRRKDRREASRPCLELCRAGTLPLLTVPAVF